MQDDDGLLTIVLVAATLVVIATLGYGKSNQLDEVEMKKVTAVIDRYEAMPDRINTAKTSLMMTELYKDMSKAYNDEKVSRHYTFASHHTASIKDTMVKLKEIKADNPWWIRDDALAYIKKVSLKMDESEKELRTPEGTLTRIKYEIDVLIGDNSVDSQYNSINESFANLVDLSVSQKEKYKDKSAKIDKTVAQFPPTIATLSSYRDIVNKNLALKYDMSYSDFQGNRNAFVDTYKNLTSSISKASHSLHSLNSSYSKVLSDRKAEYTLSFGYSHWNDYAEWDNTTQSNTKYMTIKEADYYKISESNSDLLARCKKGGLFREGGCKINVPEVSNYLKLSVPSGDTTIEYWLHGEKNKFYHQYIIEKDGKTTTTDWMPVSEKVYWDNQKNIGMALETKPIGTFTDETVTGATPPGMAYVGNPNYGSYNSSGNWMFLPIFMPSYGGYGYNRNDYDDYDSHRRNRRSTSTASTSGYYGRNSNFGTYGKRTYSKGSNFVSKTNSARKSTLSRGSRSAGSKSRGRGAGGGGK
jgi:hypothetical protein